MSLQATCHVIGAGVAGLVAALRLAQSGRQVVLHEATPVAGGRCRALPDGTDNGTHALMGANRAALRFLSDIGARDAWVEAEPEGLPVFDLADRSARRIAASPLAWRDPAKRPPGLSASGILALLRLALPIGDRPVAAAMAAHPVLYRALIEPLTVAALNTPGHEASSARLGVVLRRLGRPGAGALLVAREGLAPFVVLSKGISPFLDRVPGGRRMTVFFVGLLRAVVVLAMARYLQSALLFPLAFASLILAKVYQVSRSAMMPTVVDNDDELMSANGKFGRLTGIVGFAAGGPAVLLQRIDPHLSLAMSAVAFVLAATMTLKLPRHVAAVTSKATRAEREEMSTPEIVRAGVAMSSLRATSGFMMLHLAFWLRNEKAGLAWFAFALAIGSASTLLANSVGAPLTRKLNHHTILVSSLCVIAGTGIVAALNGSITAGIVLAGVVNGFGSIGKLAFDSIVQRHAPDANRSRVFAQYETRNQLFQVAGGLLAVLFVPSGAVGFAFIGAYATIATAYYAFKY